MNYLKKVAGARTVPIELGAHYVHPTWSQKLMTVGEFIEAYIVPQMGEDTTVGYLAQHPLFEQVRTWLLVYYQKSRSSVNIVMDCIRMSMVQLPVKALRFAMLNINVEPSWFPFQWMSRNFSWQKR